MPEGCWKRIDFPGVNHGIGATSPAPSVTRVGWKALPADLQTPLIDRGGRSGHEVSENSWESMYARFFKVTELDPLVGSVT